MRGLTLGLYPATALLAIVVLVAQNIEGLLHPAALFEDGRNILGYFYENRSLGSVWRYYASYVSLGPNLLGWMITWLPLEKQPFFLALVPIVLSAFVLALPAWRQIEIPGISSPKVRLTLIAFFLFAPVGSSSLFQLTMYSLWPMLLFVTFLSLFWQPANRLSAISVLFLALLAIASHPLVICLLPVLAWRIWRTPHGMPAFVFATMAGAICVYLAIGIDWLDRGVGRGFDAGSLWDFSRLLMERVLFETVFGTLVRIFLIGSELAWIMWGVAFILFAIIVGSALTCRDRRIVETAAVVTLLIIAYAAFGFFVRGGSLESISGHRYTFPSKILLILVTVMLVAPRVSSICQQVSWLRNLSFLLAFVWAATSFMFQRPLYEPDREAAQKISTFLREVDGRSKADSCFVLDRGEWSVALASSENATCSSDNL